MKEEIISIFKHAGREIVLDLLKNTGKHLEEGVAQVRKEKAAAEKRQLTEYDHPALNTHQDN